MSGFGSRRILSLACLINNYELGQVMLKRMKITNLDYLLASKEKIYQKSLYFYDSMPSVSGVGIIVTQTRAPEQTDVNSNPNKGADYPCSLCPVCESHFHFYLRSCFALLQHYLLPYCIMLGFSEVS